MTASGRVDFVRYAGSQQADGTEFVSLGELVSSETRSVMSSTRTMRPTVTKSRESSGAMAMLAVRCSPARVVRWNL